MSATVQQAEVSLRVVIIGLGYVGVTAAACLAAQGHDVVGVDVNAEKVETVNNGRSPIAEPEVDLLIARAVADKRLRASTLLPDMSAIDVVIVCVGTPSAPDGSHNMGFIAEATRQIARAIEASDTTKITVAFRSTFKPGTMEELIQPIFADAIDGKKVDVELVYNPEFLRESSAVSDYFRPPKIVVGTADARPSLAMQQLHAELDAPVFETGFREAELTKFIDNSWHAAKVAFANEIGRVSAAYGVEASVVHSIFVSDTKLNISPYYTRPGGAFGGSCLPKDVRALQYIARSAGVRVSLIDSLLETNEAHKAFQSQRIIEAAPPAGRVLVVGLAFKAGTDDMRESPNVDLVATLIRAGLRVSVYDPVVRTSSLMGQNLGHVLTVLPDLRSLLLDKQDLLNEEFDVLALNNGDEVDIQVSAKKVVDLRTISSARLQS